MVYCLVYLLPSPFSIVTFKHNETPGTFLLRTAVSKPPPLDNGGGIQFICMVSVIMIIAYSAFVFPSPFLYSNIPMSILLQCSSGPSDLPPKRLSWQQLPVIFPLNPTASQEHLCADISPLPSYVSEEKLYHV